MLKLGIVGATGVVGIEARNLASEILKQPVELKLFASTERKDENIFALESSVDRLKDCDAILNAAGSEQAQFVREHMLPTQVLIDNSSAFRLDPEVPLVVPEVNGEELKTLLNRPGPKIVANPNCTAAILCVALKPMQRFGLKRVNVATYQAASGAGIKGLEELMHQIRTWKDGDSVVTGGPVFKHPLFLNVMSHNSSLQAPGEAGELHNEEEWKVIQETQKLLGLKTLPMGVTSMRVPVIRAHTEAVSLHLENAPQLAVIQEAFKKAAGIKVVDDWKENHFPMPVESQNQDLVFVGRIRKDLFDAHWVHFLISGDQLRKGAATNALQILRDLIALGWGA